MSDAKTVDSEEDNPLFVTALHKGISVLRAFGARRPSMTLAEIAEAAGITRSSAQRLVFTLEALGYIRKSARSKRFQLAPRVMQLGYGYLTTDPLIDVAAPFLSELSNVTGETATLSEPDDLEMVYVARVVCTKFVPINLPVGSRIPMYCTGGGRAFLGALPEDEAMAILERSERIAHTPHTLTSVADIAEMLRLGRASGFQMNREELFIGDMTIAAPVVNVAQRPIAAVHVTAPSSRWTLEEAQRRLGPAVIECARGISRSVKGLDERGG